MKTLFLIFLFFACATLTRASDSIEIYNAGKYEYLKNSNPGTNTTDMFVICTRGSLTDTLIYNSTSKTLTFTDKTGADTSSGYTFKYKWGTGANGDTLKYHTFTKPGFYNLEASRTIKDTTWVGKDFITEKRKYNIIVVKPSIFSKLKLKIYRLKE
jgi:hypothetical protein